MCGVLHSAAAQDSRDALSYGFTSCCPNEVVEYDPVDEHSTPIAAVGTADDTFSGIVRLGLLDKERSRIFTNKKQPAHFFQHSRRVGHRRACPA